MNTGLNLHVAITVTIATNRRQDTHACNVIRCHAFLCIIYDNIQKQHGLDTMEVMTVFTALCGQPNYMS